MFQCDFFVLFYVIHIGTNGNKRIDACIFDLIQNRCDGIQKYDLFFYLKLMEIENNNFNKLKLND